MVTRRLLHHLDRPPRADISRTVTEPDPNDPTSTVEVPYVRSERFLHDAMRRTCGDRSLSTITRHTTWLGDVTYRPDDVPWGDPTHADPTVDADLELMCKRLMQHYRPELEDAMARREPWTACRALGCEDVDASVLDAIAHAIAQNRATLRRARVFRDPDSRNAKAVTKGLAVEIGAEGATRPFLATRRSLEDAGPAAA